MKFLFILSNFIFISSSFYSQKYQNEHLGNLIKDYISVKYPNEVLDKFIYIGINRQKLFLFESKNISQVFKISTSKWGNGNKLSSNQTPIGLHFISEKIGDGAEIGTLFVNKKNTGKVVSIDSSKGANSDEITTRIMSLSGKQPNFNKGSSFDTFKRGIYIHGTSDENSIGYPSSHGCIRMLNQDVIKLFNKIDIGISVFLIEN
tara:strand:+ start:157 stop:768 length:612 start_codon:yes stop_codon:yes gene_type:complete